MVLCQNLKTSILASRKARIRRNVCNSLKTTLSRNHMNGTRSFVAASILCLHDTCFLYPACQKCGSRLLINHGKFQCPKKDCLSIVQNVNYRYRLSVKVAEKCEIFNITVFGSCLEPYFGAAAGFLHRYCEAFKKELQEPEEETVQDLLVQAVEHCFVGRSFIFGVKASKSQTSVLSFSPSLLQSTTRKNKCKKHLIACQILEPNTTVYGCTVINYYKKLVDSIHSRGLSSTSVLSASPLISIAQSTPKFNSLSGSTQLTGVSQLTNPWQQDFALTFFSGDCATVEELSIAGTSRVSLKRRITSLEHDEGTTCSRKYKKQFFGAFAASLPLNSSDSIGCNANTVGSLPSCRELQRLTANQYTHQYYDTRSVLVEDCLETSSDSQILCLQKLDDSMSNWKGSVILPSDKSCPLDCGDSLLWDELPFSESLGEFIAKVEADLERCDEENAPTKVNDVAIHSCSLNKIETEKHSGMPEQKRRSGKNSTKCKLLKVKTKNRSSSGDSHNLNDTDHLVLAGSLKNDVTEMLFSPGTPLLWTRDDTCAARIPNPVAAGKICSVLLTPTNVDNCKNYSDQTIQTKVQSHLNDQAGESVTFPAGHAVKGQDTNNSYALSNAVVQIPLTSSKRLLTKEENFCSQIQDLEHNSNKCNQEPFYRSRMLSIFKNENSLFQNVCTSTEEYDVSRELFSDVGGYEEETPLCFNRNLSILSQKSVSKLCNKTACKPDEQQRNISLHFSDTASDTIIKQVSNSSPENDSQKLIKCDFPDSQDYIPFSQSTPISRVKHFKCFGLDEKKAFKMSPYVQSCPKEAVFEQKQVVSLKNDFQQQSLQIPEVSLNNQISISSTSSLLDNRPVSKSFINDSDEWIPPSTVKTQLISRFSSYVSDVCNSQGFELFKNVSHISAAAMETTDSKITMDSNKGKDSSKHFRGHLFMKRTPAGNCTTPSLQRKFINSKFSQKRTEKLGPHVSKKIQIGKSLKMNKSMSTTFHTLFAESEALGYYSPELFAASTEFFEDEKSF